MNLKKLMISINKDTVKVALANQRVEAKRREVFDDDGIFMNSEYDSDLEFFKQESRDLRNETLEDIKNIMGEI